MIIGQLPNTAQLHPTRAKEEKSLEANPVSVHLLTSASLCTDCLALIKLLASQVQEEWKYSQAPSLRFSVLHGYYRFPLQNLEDRFHINFEAWTHSYHSCWCSTKCYPGAAERNFNSELVFSLWLSTEPQWSNPPEQECTLFKELIWGWNAKPKSWLLH